MFETLLFLIFSNVWISLTSENFNKFLKSFSSVNYFNYLNDNYKKNNKHARINKKNIFETIYKKVEKYKKIEKSLFVFFFIFKQITFERHENVI